MKGGELLRKLKRAAKARGVAIVIDQHQGKGSHARLYFGDKSTTLKDSKKEIGEGLLRQMLADLGLTKDDL
jgi:mRNA interferase HicA